MPREFILTVAEYHQAKYRAQANSLQEAIKAFINGKDVNGDEVTMIDGSVKYVEIDEERGRMGLVEVVDKKYNKEYCWDEAEFEKAYLAALRTR